MHKVKVSQVNSLTTESKSRGFLATILFLQFVLYATVFFDIPVARQVVGFIYFTFVPGFVIVKLLRLDNVDGVETWLLSVGLSVAFLMIVGLLVNEFGPLFGIQQPLSLILLIVILSSITLVCAIFAHIRNERITLWSGELSGSSSSGLFFVFLPILSILGTMWVNAYGNNLILIFMIIAIALLFAIGVISKRLPPRLYPFIVLMIAVSLLYYSSLISNHIVSFGSDVPAEYSVFRTTADSMYWNSTPMGYWSEEYSRVNAMLSVTVLPTTYSTLLNIDPAWMLKALFPLIFSFAPLGLYQVVQKYVGKKYAFISAFLLMAQSTFYTEMLGLNRQMVGELFFVLLLLVVLNKRMKTSNKILCFTIFSFALVTSHYALAEIFLFFISFTSISLIILKRSSRNITLSMVAFFFVLMFTWYIYTSGSTVFDSFVEFGDNVYRQLGDFFNLESRGQTVLRGLGLEEAPTIWNAISRIFAYITQALIVFGFIGVILRRTKFHFEKEYFVFGSAAMALLAALILVPGLANTLNMTRFYHILLFFLAPFCAIGAEVIAKLVNKQDKGFGVSLLLIVVLVPYFLFQTGFVYELTETESWSLPLSMHRMPGFTLHVSLGYLSGQDVSSVKWMSKNLNNQIQYRQVYADASFINTLLISLSTVPPSYVNFLSNVTQPQSGGVVYLSSLNLVEQIVVGTNRIWSTREISPVFSSMNTIYSSGASEIYKDSST